MSAEYLRRSDDPDFTAHHGSSSVHPNAITSTSAESRRVQQATQYQRRFSAQQTADVRAVLRAFDLGEWDSLAT